MSTRLFCQPCADVAERWVTLHPITRGACAACGRHQELYGVRQQPPEAGFTIQGGRLSQVVANLPWRCPCCGGKGQIENALRRRTQGHWLAHRTPCLACGGGGLVWSEGAGALGGER